MPPHPTLFVKRIIYENFGLFNIELKSATDYELMLRFLYKFNTSVIYVDEVLTIMRDGGNSNQSLIHRIKANKEDYRSWIMNNIGPTFLLRLIKVKELYKLFLYMKTLIFDVSKVRWLGSFN